MKQILTHLRTYWGIARSSLWFLPSVLVAGTVVLSFALLSVDRLYAGDIASKVPWLFSGTPSAARTLLSTIATAVITVISIAFSLTIIAIQQASVQYSPRVLRTFTSDTGNQIVLGAYIATFVYALLVLRAIRDPDEDGGVGFVPAIAATTAIVLALVCIGLLIYFINHIAGSLQAATIIARVHGELLRQIDDLYPASIGEPARPEETERREREVVSAWRITAERAGFVLHISEDALSQTDIAPAQLLRIYPKVGDYVMEGQTIADLDIAGEAHRELAARVRQAVGIGDQRSGEQDPLYAVRQLVDMALRALSPGINDPTTAEYCIRFLGNALCRLAEREFPQRERSLHNGGTIVYLSGPTWEEFVDDAFRQICHEAAGKVRVLTIVLDTLYRIALRLPGEERVHPVRALVEKIDGQVQNGLYEGRDRLVLQEGMERVSRALQEVAAPGR